MFDFFFEKNISLSSYKYETNPYRVVNGHGLHMLGLHLSCASFHLVDVYGFYVLSQINSNFVW